MIITSEAILAIIANKGVCSRGEIATALGCDSEILKPYLMSLKGAGKISQSGIKRGAKYAMVDMAATPAMPAQESHVVENVPAPVLGINKRFTIMSKLVKIVATGQGNSLLITGQGGTGKTGEVLRTLTEDLGLEARNPGQTVDPETQFLHVKGKAAAADLYRVLFENPDALLVFDDCDSVLDGDGMNILKAALDTYKTRVVSWQSKYVQGTLGLPESFEFRGTVIFITNRKTVDQALQSRGYVVNLQMSPDDLVDRLDTMGRKMCPEVSAEQHDTLIAFMRENKLRFKDLSLRTYIKIVPMMDEEGWEEAAIFAN